MKRDAFLARIRDAAAAGRAHRVRLPQVEDQVGYVGVQGDACVALADEIEAVGGHALVVENHAAAREHLALLLEQYQVRSALCWQHEVLDRIQLPDLLSERKIKQLDFAALQAHNPAEQRAEQLAADMGITSVACAVAETGSLMLCSGPGRERVSSLLPPVHVAIVERRQIVPDLLDAVAQLETSATKLPSNIAFVTGPSKTGDIELQLTTGVHGPGAWHVVVIA